MHIAGETVEDGQRVRRRFLVSFLLGLASLFAIVAKAEDKASSADEFVGSAGVNIHLSYTDTLYFKDFELIHRSLGALGVRHVRDSLPAAGSSFYERYNELASSGIRVDLIATPDENEPVIDAAIHGMPSAIEDFEAPNEYDQHPETWEKTLRLYLKVLYRAAKHSPGSSSYPVFGPSLTREQSYSRLGEVTACSDFGNLHNYFAGHNPGTRGWGDKGYGSIDWNLKNVEITNPGQPVVTTETGFTNQATAPGTVPEEVAARYLPRLLLEQWNHGIKRTYLYELLSSGGEDFGMLRSDGSRKPGFQAVSTLLQMLKDPGQSTPLDSLPYTLSGAEPNLHHALFEKHDGSFFLALWIEEPAYDVDARRLTEVPAQHLQIAFEGLFPDVTSFEFDDAGVALSHQLGARKSLTQTITDRLTVLKIVPASKLK